MSAVKLKSKYNWVEIRRECGLTWKSLIPVCDNFNYCRVNNFTKNKCVNISDHFILHNMACISPYYTYCVNLPENRWQQVFTFLNVLSYYVTSNIPKYISLTILLTFLRQVKFWIFPKIPES